MALVPGSEGIRKMFVALGALALLCVLFAGMARPAHAATFTVNSKADVGADGCDATECTLREAITAANAAAGPDTIAFDIPDDPNVSGNEVQTITVGTALPAITDPVTINGFTQPGAAANTLASGDNAVRLISLNAGLSILDGLRINVGNSIVRGLTIRSFTRSIFLSGVDAGASLIQGNDLQNVLVDNAPDNTIGGTAPAARNVITSNTLGPRIRMQGTNASGNAVQGNLIESGSVGVSISGGQNNSVGGPSAAARNVISGLNTNPGHAVEMGGSGNLVQGNHIGINAAGDTVVPNLGDGVRVNGGSGNTIKENVISGSANGVSFSGSSTTATAVEGNLIGTDAQGGTCLDANGASLGNATGVSISSPNNTVGGTIAEARNVISCNASDGVRFNSGGTGSKVLGNYIGTDESGTNDLGNGASGISINNARGSIIGGAEEGARNVISGNDQHGVSITNTSTNTLGVTGNEVLGNYIGTEATGTGVLGNTLNGVSISSSTNTPTTDNAIGGTAAGEGNVISGNGGYGVAIFSADGNRVQGNRIGTGPAGSGNLRNELAGLHLDNASENTIGGEEGAANTVAFNGDDGVRVVSGAGNALLYNEIFSNTGLGIDLDPDGVTANDAGDADTGPNNLQNFPAITSARRSLTGNTTIRGSLDGAANTTFTVQFFASPGADRSGNGEGRVYLGQKTDVTTDATGNTSFAFITSRASAGQVVSATATGPSGDTSEFSRALAITLNQLPTISVEMPGILIGQDTDTGEIPFTVGDAETPAGDLTLEGSSDNQGLVPDSNIVFGGSGAERTVKVTPASGQTGTANITITVVDSDGGVQSDTFFVTVFDNVAPTVESWGPIGTRVLPTANVTATFSEAMDPETIDGTTVKLVKKGTTTPVAATLSLPAPDKVVLDPNKSFARGATYTATIVGAGDLAGNLLDQDPATPGEQPKTWTFKVRR